MPATDNRRPARRPTWLGLTLLLGLTALAGWAAWSNWYAQPDPLSTQDRIQQLRQANDAFLAGDQQQAVAIYERLLKRAPDDAVAMQRLAAVRMALNQWPQALKLARRLAESSPTQVVGLTLQGAIHHHANERIPAIQAFQRVLELDPRLEAMPLSPRYLFWEYLARDLLAEGRTADARAALKRGLAEGDQAQLMALMGEAYLRDGAELDAAPWFERAIDLAPAHADPWLNLGRIAIHRSQWADAERFLIRAAELSPDSVDPIYSLSQVYRRLGRVQEADHLQHRIATLRQREAGSP